MTDSVDGLMRELRRARDEIPQWVDAFARQQQQEVRAESTGGSVRVSCTGSGDITRVEIQTYFLRASGAGRVDAAILEALQAAQAAASRQVTDHQEKLQFMGLPIGEVLTGKRSLSDLFPELPPGGPSPQSRSEDKR